jgi:hypothetical protein
MKAQFLVEEIGKKGERLGKKGESLGEIGEQ